MIIRPHTQSDFNSIAELRWKLKTEDLASEKRPDKDVFITSYLDHLKHEEAVGQTTHWVAAENNDVFGVVTLRRVSKDTSLSGKGGAWGYVTNVYVVGDKRNRRIGTYLLADCISCARSQGLEFLLVWPSERSRSLYERAGFEGSSDPLIKSLEED